MSTVRVNAIQSTVTTDGGISIDSSGHVTLDGQSLPSTGPLSNRNVFHNGAMQVDQRNTASSSIIFDAGGTTSGYSVDGCKFYNLGTGELDLRTEQVTEAPVGFSNSLRVTVATAESSGGTPAADDRATLQMRLEGNVTTNFALGTSDAKDFVLSFYVRASTAGNYGLVVTNSSDRSYPVLYNIASANTWERKTIKLPACTDGTWSTGTSTGLILKFSFYVGSNRLGTDQGVDGSGTWVTNQTAQGTTNQVQFGGTVDETWHLTGVQLEVGQVATPFEHRSLGDELARCQRYFEKSVNYGTAPGASTNPAPTLVGSAYTTTLVRTQVHYKVSKRATPTITPVPSATGGTGTQWARYNGSWAAGSTSVAQSNENAFSVDVTTTGISAFSTYLIDGNWYASAEL